MSGLHSGKIRLTENNQRNCATCCSAALAVPAGLLSKALTYELLTSWEGSVLTTTDWRGSLTGEVGIVVAHGAPVAAL